MRMKLWLAALLGLSLLVVVVVHQRNFGGCHHTESAAATAGDSDAAPCCSADKAACCLPEGKAEAPEPTGVQASDPDRQLVFRVEGFRCPAVKGIGCGHMLYPALASLDKLDGVQASSANYTGTLIRVCVTRATDRAQVAEAVRKVLVRHEPAVLAGDDFRQALQMEQWRETGRIGELSAIEFRTVGFYRIKTFAQAEKVDQETTAKLTKMAEDQWERLTQEAKKEKVTQPEDWRNRCQKSAAVFVEQARAVLSDEQFERFKKALTTPCRGDDRPEAPPAPGDGKKTPSDSAARE